MTIQQQHTLARTHRNGNGGRTGGRNGGAAANTVAVGVPVANHGHAAGQSGQLSRIAIPRNGGGYHGNGRKGGRPFTMGRGRGGGIAANHRGNREARGDLLRIQVRGRDLRPEYVQEKFVLFLLRSVFLLCLLHQTARFLIF